MRPRRETLRRACVFPAVLALATATQAVRAQTGERVASAPVAVIRALDKLTGETTDLELARGEMRRYGRLALVLGDGRIPANDPSSEEYAELEIRDPSMTEPAFSGWMLASSPALHAMDHPRYDIWVLRCKSS